MGAPFSIVAGGSFSLTPGQPQEMVVRFSPTTKGGFSGSVQLSSNGGSKTVALTAGTITVSPASLNCTAFVGSPQEQKLTLKNDGSVAVTVDLGQLSAPFAVQSSVGGLGGGQTQEVVVQFNPTASGNFTGNQQLALSGACVRWSEEVIDGRSRCLAQSLAQGSANVALAGVAHKIKIEPEKLEFGLVFVSTSQRRKLVIKNEGLCLYLPVKSV